MSPYARLAAYGAGLLALVAVGFGVGSVAGGEPDRGPGAVRPTTTVESTPTTTGGSGHGHG